MNVDRSESRTIVDGLIRSPLLAVLLVLGVPAMSAEDAACDEQAVHRASEERLEFAYRSRPPANYCDGMTPVYNGGELSLVSLTLGDIAYPPGKSRLDLRAPGALTTTAIHVRGQDSRPQGSYRLDGLVTASVLSVDLGAVLLPRKIPSDSLGFLAWQRINGDVHYTPLQMADTDRGGAAKAVLTTPLRVLFATRQLCESVDAGCSPIEPIADVQPAGRGQGSLLRFDLSLSGHPDVFRLKVNTYSPGGTVGSLSVPIVWMPAR